MTCHVTRPDTYFPPQPPWPAIAHDTFLPSALREFQTELAGRLVLMDQPGGEVKALRERYGFTQEWLAGVLPMRRESVSRIESGRIQPTVAFIQRFTRIVTLARGVREHLAYAEARGNHPDDALLNGLAVGLRLDRATADEVVLASTMAYDAKRRQALRALPPRSSHPPRPGATASSGALREARASAQGYPTPTASTAAGTQERSNP